MHRHFATLITVALLLVVGCSRKVPDPQVVVTTGATDGSIPPPRLIVREFPNDAFMRGVGFLLKQQSPDGAWRSDVYATFKDGTALTPLVVVALQDAASAGFNSIPSADARKKAVSWLAKFVKEDGTIDPGPDGFDYPIYTAALTVRALSHPENAVHKKARDAWVKYILDRQLTEKLGWRPEERQFGGWGYCRVIPKKPDPNMLAPSLIESNMSATVFALDALKAAGVDDAAVYMRAETFLLRCQNGDGGFHFIYDDPTRNKAGMASAEPLEFHSYGSTTADGLRGLSITEPIRDQVSDRAVGREDFANGKPSPQAKAAAWLQKNFRADTHPGVYVKAHEPNREAVYYYYAASVSRAFRDLKLTPDDGSDWAGELAAQLAKRQKEDGSWVNPAELVRENDPIVATANAVSALAKCRK
jgi:squalene-hopene/tetraprenyl-beta-curcumene cyclase